jgi:(2R)-ethylmalonyl-CoA mutase
MLAVTMSKDARARAVQLPAWNEALGLPRPWDQQWSLRMQQVLAFESDLLEYDDLFAGSAVVEAKVDQIAEGARAEIDRILEMGGAVAAVESGYLKSALVSSLALRRRRIESGEDVVVGVNKYTETEPNPLVGGSDGGILTVDPAVEERAVAAIREWRAGRDAAVVEDALTLLRDAAKTDENLMPASLACARAGVTVGEWAGVLREVFGEYRPPTGIAGARRATRPASEVPGRQARIGRAFQRRRADRGAGARRRFRGGLLRHPADPGPDRGRRRRGGRRRGGALGALRLAPVRRAGRGGRAAGERSR